MSVFLVTTGCGQHSDPSQDLPSSPATLRGSVTTAPRMSSITAANLSKVAGAFCFVLGTERFDTTDRDGAFIITDVPAGRYRLLCETADAEGRPLSLLETVDVKTGDVTDLGWISISPTGRVRGATVLADHTDHTGIRVSLLPLALEITTDASGAFELDDVPAADYEIRFKRDGYRTAVVDVVVGSQQTTFVNEVILKPE